MIIGTGAMYNCRVLSVCIRPSFRKQNLIKCTSRDSLFKRWKLSLKALGVTSKRKQAPNLNQFILCNLRSMKSYAVFSVLFALLLVSEADFFDKSYVETSPRCRSRLDVSLQGYGKHELVTVARLKCSQRCSESVNKFKKIRCPELCSYDLRTQKEQRTAKCFLCYKNEDKYIQYCRIVMNDGVRKCMGICATADPEQGRGHHKVVQAHVGPFTKLFPGKFV